MSLLATQGLGASGNGTAFALTSITPGLNYIDLVFSNAIVQITGPAALASQYGIAPTDGTSVQVQVLSVAVVGTNVRLTTTECTNGGTYQMAMPWQGFSDGGPEVLTGPFSMSFVGFGQAPTLISANPFDTRLIDIAFSELVRDTEALNPANYAINNGLSVSAVTKTGLVNYRLTTSRQVRGQSYTVTASNIHDLAGNLVM